jgi:hypothetical protein
MIYLGGSARNKYLTCLTHPFYIVLRLREARNLRRERQTFVLNRGKLARLLACWIYFLAN